MTQTCVPSQKTLSLLQAQPKIIVKTPPSAFEKEKQSQKEGGHGYFHIHLNV
jgi:hypothetical protein